MRINFTYHENDRRSEYLNTDPDLTKIYYFNEKGISDKVMGAHGLRLKVAQAIIDSARAAGLEVYAHVEDRQDFEKMAQTDVDAFAHMSGYGWNGDSSTFENYFLPDSLLRQTAKRGVVINPTAVLASFSFKDAKLDSIADFQCDLSRRYRKMQGNLIIGSDIFNSTETSMQIFPSSAIGQIRDGYKADFLVFDQKPIAEKSVKKPERVFVEGKLMFEN